jgi:hypothetical protein
MVSNLRLGNSFAIWCGNEHFSSHFVIDMPSTYHNETRQQNLMFDVMKYMFI